MLENSRICSIAKKAIMVLSLTVTDKTTLINYLNDVPLAGMKKDSNWRVTLKNESHRLPCGFEIGHNTHSQTHLPHQALTWAGVSPSGRGCSSGCDLETLIGISDDKRFCTGREYKLSHLPNSYKDEMISKLKALKFLISLLQKGNRGESNFRQMWLRYGTGQNLMVSTLIDEQARYLKQSYDA